LRWKLLIGAALVVVLLAAGAVVGVVLYRNHLSHGVRGSSTVEFVPTEAPKAPHIRGAIEWPNFGNGADQTRVGPSAAIRPPYRTDWVAGGRSLLEFPPAIGYRRLFLANAGGDLMALNAKTGRRAWTRHVKRCVAASPAIGRFQRGTVYESFLGRTPCLNGKSKDGEVIAVSAGTGALRWRLHTGPSESSPLVVGNHLYVGDWRGFIYDVNAWTGKIRWKTRVRGAVKGAMAYTSRRVYAGAYDGHVYALNAATGKIVWTAKSDARLFGHGRFYSTPAVAYGRVYIGSTDGKVYSFGATTGKRRWSAVTGGYVYGSPAVWNRRVYVGSYDGYFYALDAATGQRIWRVKANGPISGSANVVDGIVYFATLKGRTYALDSRSGKVLWTFHDGKYAPVTTDGKRVFLLGFGKAYGLLPKVR
jgi:outer membrane protein assembly factor BamB